LWTGIPIGISLVYLGFAHTACNGASWWDDSYPGNGLSTSSSGAGGNGSSSVSGSGGDLIIDMDGDVCTLTCSNDLKSVVDCRDVVKKQCTADQACANAECIDDPCKAAAVSQSSLGCDYWALKTALRPQADGACFAAFVANTWAKPVHLDVSYDGNTLNPATFAYTTTIDANGNVAYTAYDAVAGLAPGEVAILFLSRYSQGVSVIDCPKPAALDIETGFSSTGRGKAFHITADYPVVAYQMVPFNGGTAAVTSASLLLPTSAWGTNYIAVDGYKAIPDPPPPANPIGGYPWTTIAANQPTKVTILPKAAIVAGPGVAAAMANTPITYSLVAGEFLQITQPAELSGSIIESDKPIALFGGSTCMRVPTTQSDCDSAQQQIPAVGSLGNEYVAVRHKSRDPMNEEPTRWRLVGVVNGTTLTWSPKKPPNAPTAIELGEVLEFEDPGPFVVKSQDGKHPFYVGGYMTGGAPFGNVGDPEWNNVVPPQQFLPRYVFFTDPTYPETSLVVIRVKSKQVNGTFAPVTLKCRGELTGWTPLGEYEWTRVDLVTGNFTSVDGCTNGAQEMTSEQPFGVTVWGWGTTQQTLRVSYAYPAGAGFRPINEIKVPPTPN
jgi:hypothetical protein